MHLENPQNSILQGCKKLCNIHSHQFLSSRLSEKCVIQGRCLWKGRQSIRSSLQQVNDIIQISEGTVHKQTYLHFHEHNDTATTFLRRFSVSKMLAEEAGFKYSDSCLVEMCLAAQSKSNIQKQSQLAEKYTKIIGKKGRNFHLS